MEITEAPLLNEYGENNKGSSSYHVMISRRSVMVTVERLLWETLQATDENPLTQNQKTNHTINGMVDGFCDQENRDPKGLSSTVAVCLGSLPLLTLQASCQDPRSCVEIKKVNAKDPVFGLCSDRLHWP